jgi:alpha-beta hydrolase superfamily lysophospholipase
MVLNSPWFDLAGGWLLRGPVTAAIDVIGAISPSLVVSGLGPHYGRSIHRSGTGEWDYDLRWKPIEGFPVRAGWFRAVRRGHAELAAGLAIDVPVLVSCSAASGPNDRWHDAIMSTDSVLDVTQIVAKAPRLGPDVTITQIDGGIHDLTLSPEPARSGFFRTVAGWIDARVPPS